MKYILLILAIFADIFLGFSIASIKEVQVLQVLAATGWCLLVGIFYTYCFWLQFKADNK